MKRQMKRYIGAGTFSVRGAHDVPNHPPIITEEDSDSKVQTPQNYSLPKTFYEKYPDRESIKSRLGLVRLVE